MKEKETMEKPMSALGFRLMSLMFKIRDLIQPRADVLNEAELNNHRLEVGGFELAD
jgi:hypothetical protein